MGAGRSEKQADHSINHRWHCSFKVATQLPTCGRCSVNDNYRHCMTPYSWLNTEYLSLICGMQQSQEWNLGLKTSCHRSAFSRWSPQQPPVFDLSSSLALKVGGKIRGRNAEVVTSSPMAPDMSKTCRPSKEHMMGPSGPICLVMGTVWENRF